MAGYAGRGTGLLRCAGVPAHHRVMARPPRTASSSRPTAGGRALPQGAEVARWRQPGHFLVG